MTNTKPIRRRGLVVLASVLALAAAACGSDKDSGTADTTAAPAATTGSTAPAATTAAGDKPVTINWWHIQNNDPGKTDWQTMADQFMKDHPNVTIKINVLENEAFKAALQTNLQAGDVPDLFQSWGGGGLREQVKAGLVQDVSSEASDFIGNLNPSVVGLYQVDGKQYGVPFDAGMVGFWYNKALFAKAGIDAPPATWDEFLADVQKLKDAGITPLAVGAGDKWPAHFYYAYLMLRIGGAKLMEDIAADGNFDRPEVIKAGDELKKLIDLEPFQSGFLATPWDGADGEAGYVGSGKVAMDLMGQWAPGAFKNAGAAGGDLSFDLGWFPFPTVAGGAGKATDAFGGGNGFAVGKDAPPEAVEFLKFITDVQNADVWGKNSGLPVTKGSESSVTDPNQQMVLAGLNGASFVQLYLDQYFTPDVGAAVNDAVQTLFAGTASSEEVAKAITSAAQAG
jgi:raffinose/stachyose/melibiose transport system substrate-binding protein